MSEANKTMIFESCRAVFQGGGCRGLALVGAYETAIKRGVNFTSLSGTSAGSIIAVFIGAGASPEHLTKIMSELDFRSFLVKPSKQDGFSSKRMKFLSIILGLFSFSANVKSIRSILDNGGLYSSKQIEIWIDEQLAELLPHATRPIRFNDLIIPTSVVATDLASNKVKVWGTEQTPDEAVGFAVRASSSIPLFFQAIVQGKSRFVDGGILSNLPTFVFTEKTEENRRPYAGPILAFTLKEEYEELSIWNPKTLLTRTVDASVSGAVSLQLLQSKNVLEISIPTFDIKATDFDKMTEENINKLLKSGQDSSRSFFDDELNKLSSVTENNPVCSEKYESLYAIVQESQNLPREILIIEDDSEWFWKLFPTVFNWLRNQVNVKIALPAFDKNNTKELHRRTVLEGLGAQILELPEIGLKGFVFKRNDPNSTSAIIYNNGVEGYGAYATRYSGRSHQSMLKMIYSSFNSKFESLENKVNSPIEVIRMEEVEICKRIKTGVHQYSGSNVALKLETVFLKDIDLIVRYLRAYKYLQMRNLIKFYKDSDYELFESLQIKLLDGNPSFITPPVIEKRGSRYVVIEGNTRVFSCWKEGIKSIKCIVVRGVENQPLPGKPVSINKVIVETKHMSAEQRLKGFNYDHFRRIEGSVHQG